jgi:predicted DNA binding CopG/RHH family protein
MAKKGKTRRADRDEPIGNLKRVADFLPPPNELLPSEEALKITLSIDSETVAFFKEMAEKNGTKYQRMMREVLKGYARRYAS